jgi:hypothetical protein
MGEEVMRTDRRPPSQLWRVLFLAGVCLLGLATIVGSGGGSVGFPPCEPPLCGGPTPPLVVRIDPAEVTAQVGSSVTFTTVQISTYGIDSYQWRRSADGGLNYSDIVGATASSLVLPSVNLADDGAMFMVVARAGETLQAQAVAHLAVTATTPVVFQDGEFDLADWTVTTQMAPGTPVFSPSVERSATGGNPDAFLLTRFVVPSNTGTVTVLYLSNRAAYDPVTQGAIQVIDYAEECAALVRGTATVTDSRLLIEQGGRRFVSPDPGQYCVSSSWKPVANRMALRAADFLLLDGSACAAAEPCPDFSATAATLRFGFIRVTRSYPNEEAVHGIDNWKVTVWRH